MEPTDPNLAGMAPAPDPPKPRGVAPMWHTVLLIAGLAVLSVEGAREIAARGSEEPNHFVTYGTSIVSELLMLAWVYLGLRLRKVPFVSLFGDIAGGVKTFFIDLGAACVFWFGSLIVLGTIGITWTLTELAMEHRSLFSNHGKPLAPDPAQQKVLHSLTSLAPSDAREVAAWALVCITAGLVEELVFRGYFQRQFTAWSRGAIAAGIVFSSLMFGAAHGYQGIRNMVLLTVFGALFSLLAVFRRNLRAGMFAHAWHDFFIGLLLAFAKARHLI